MFYLQTSDRPPFHAYNVLFRISKPIFRTYVFSYLCFNHPYLGVLYFGLVKLDGYKHHLDVTRHQLRGGHFDANFLTLQRTVAVNSKRHCACAGGEFSGGCQSDVIFRRNVINSSTVSVPCCIKPDCK